MIELIFNDVEVPELSENILHAHVSNLIEDGGFLEGELIFVLMSDEDLLKYNIELLNHDFYTDVITIDQKVGNIISGEILISIDRVKENAIDHSVAFMEELYRVIFHGILHIIGYNDKTPNEIKVMRSLENFYISKVSF